MQFPEEEGYIIFLFLKTIYYFNNNGNYINSFDLDDLSYIDNVYVSNYDITYYKKEGLEYYYTIAVCDSKSSNSDVKMHLFYYKINLDGNNRLITKSTYYNTEEPIVQYFTITCQKLVKNDNNKYITCFYQYSKYGIYLIKELSFEPDNNFSYINNNKYIETIDTQHIFRYAVSTTNEDNSKAYVCYSSYNQYASCFYFDINQNEFSTIFKFGEKNCLSHFYSINLNYNKKNKECVFSCINDNANGYFVIKFKENINLIKPNINGEFSKFEDECYETKTSSIIYLTKYDQYNLFTYNKCWKYSGNFEIRWYDLTNYFNDTSKSSSSDTVTTEIIQTNIESTILNEETQTINIPVSTEINVISTTSPYETQDSTEQTEKLTENDSTVQTEKLTENDSTVQTEKLTENDYSTNREIDRK